MRKKRGGREMKTKKGFSALNVSGGGGCFLFHFSWVILDPMRRRRRRHLVRTWTYFPMVGCCLGGEREWGECAGLEAAAGREGGTKSTRLEPSVIRSYVDRTNDRESREPLLKNNK